MQDWRKRVDELRAEPTNYGKPMGIWKIDGILRGEVERGETSPYTQSELREYLGIGQACPLVDGEDLGPTPTVGTIQPPPLEAPKRKMSWDRAADAFFEWIGKPADHTFPRNAEPYNRDAERYALFSDIHAPWHDPKALYQAVEEAKAEDCSTLIIGGDGFDFYRLSRYAKSKQIRFEDELAKCRMLVEWLATQFNEVLIVAGNHDGGRWERVLAEQIAEEIRFLVRSPLDLLTADLPNVRFVGHKAPFGNEVSWLYQLGEDCIITHCEASSAQQGVNVAKLKDWLREWAPVLGLTERPRCITTGHTHRATALHDYDRLLIETGTLASWDAQGYQYQAPGGAQLKNRKPGVQAWTLIVQKDGRTDLRESRVIRLRG